LLFCNITRYEFHIDVRIEGGGQILSPWVNRTTALSKLILLLANVVVNNKEFSIRNNLLVHSLDGRLSVCGVLEAHISVVFVSAVLTRLNMSRFDSSKLGKKSLKALVIGACREILDEEVIFLGCSLLFNRVIKLLLVLLSELENFNGLAFEFLSVQSLNCSIGMSYILELNVSKASAFLAVRIGLKFG